MSEIFAEILLPLALDKPYTYLDEIGVELGDVVAVEFGKKKIWGVVVGCQLPVSSCQWEGKTKKILEKNSRLKLGKNQLKFLEELSLYNLASRGLVLRAMIGILNSDKVKKIPQGLKQEVNSQKFFLKKLSSSQQEVTQGITNLMLDGEEKNEAQKPVLLQGVTGSGKTEVYFSLIAKILAEASQKNSDAQILILLPEIALTSQLLLRFEQQFGFIPALWHSKISKKEKREVFFGIADGSVRVMIGARSALLLPFKNLQLVVIDEEHDSSFKQQDVFNFHARDMAILRAKIENFLVILSSATPALETYANAVLGKYHHFLLEQKFGSKNEIELIDLRREKLAQQKFLSQKLSAEIEKNLAEKKQTLLFLNRRGYAPVTLCKTCGKKYECPDCDFHLVLHKSKNRLACHHCGHRENLENQCKFCGEKDSLISIGVGVEKLEEEVRSLFPQARVALITSDNVTNFFEVDELVKKILAHEIDIIIGTQMIAKGHDFPDLTLVGIVDFDGMLYSSELRALERAYQLLTQVMGRAGRREIAGRIVVQTYNPQNFLFEKILRGEEKSFYEFELKNRQSLELPPFARLAKFEVSSFVESEAKNFAKNLIQNFPYDEKIELFGPAPAPLQRLKNRHHFLVNLKTSRKVNLQKLIRDVLAKIVIPKSIRLRVDIDPL